MICAIDYGSCWIRSAFRSPEPPPRLVMYAEKSEYAMLPASDVHRRSLTEQSIPYAECDGSMAVVGNHAAKAQWLSRVPCTSLLADGVVPTSDPPARQMLSLLTDAMLPLPMVKGAPCAVAVNAVPTKSEDHSAEFLCRLVRMRGYEPLLVNPAEAALLASGRDAAFTGISIVCGAQSTALSVSRLGVQLAAETLKIGSNWVDTEIAKQFQIQSWDDDGTCYLDLESVRRWKAESGVHLRNPLAERERVLVRLSTVLLDRVTRSIVQLLASPAVRTVLQQQRLALVLSGGGVLLDGFSSVLTERLVEHGIAERVLYVRVAQDAATAVVRGALIMAELEARRASMADAA